MANEQQNNTWPLPKFYFIVEWEGVGKIPFQEVSGLDTETQVIDYRHNNSPVFSTIKMPGIVKYGNVTMKKGIFTNDNTFWAWYNEIKMNTIKRVDITVTLLDEKGGVTMKWVLINAWPTKITSTDLKSDGNEVAVETIEIAHEGLAVSNG